MPDEITSEEFFGKPPLADSSMSTEEFLSGPRPEFIRRMMDPNAPVRQNPDGTTSTHLMAHDIVEGRWIAYPTLVHKDGALVELSREEALSDAMSRGNFKEFPDEVSAGEYAKGSWKSTGDFPKRSPAPSPVPLRGALEPTEAGVTGKAYDFAAKAGISARAARERIVAQDGKEGWTSDPFMNDYITRIMLNDPAFLPSYFRQEDVDESGVLMRWAASAVKGLSDPFIDIYVGMKQGTQITNTYWRAKSLDDRLYGTSAGLSDIYDPGSVMEMMFDARERKYDYRGSDELKKVLSENPRMTEEQGLESLLQLRESEIRTYPGYDKARDTALREMASVTMPAPKNTSQILGDVAGGLTAFSIKVAMGRAVFSRTGLPSGLSRALAWEAAGSGGIPGEQAALLGTMNLVHAIPSKGITGGVLKTLAAMGIFGGIAKAKDLETRDVLIQAMIPAVMQFPAVLRYFRGRLANAKTPEQQRLVLLDMAAAKDLKAGKPTIAALAKKMGVSIERAGEKPSAPTATTAKPTTIGQWRKEATKLGVDVSDIKGKGATARIEARLDEYARRTLSARAPQDPSEPGAKAVSADEALAKLSGQIKRSLRPQTKRRDELQELYRKEHARRAAMYENAYNKSRAKGDSHAVADHKAIKALGGKLVPDQQLPPELRPTMLEGEWEALRAVIYQTYPGQMNVYRRVDAMRALRKLGEGIVLQPAEIDKLHAVFGHDLSNVALGQATLSGRIAEGVLELTSIPRTLIASGDISATFRQLKAVLYNDVGNAVTFHRLSANWLKASSKGFVSFFSKKYADRWAAALRKDPWYQRAKRAGVQFTDAGKSTDPSGRPEGFASQWMQNLPLVRHAARSMSVAGNTARRDLFKTIIDNLEKNGVKVSRKTEAKFASMISDLTGRSQIPNAKIIEDISGFANRVMFSPRFALSRIKNTTLLFHTISNDPHVMKEGIRTLVGAVTTTAAIGTVAAAYGFDVELDPRSSDFLKARRGDTRFDMTGGHGQVIRFIAYLACQKRKTAAGHLEEVAWHDATWRFIRSKQAPIIGLIHTATTGRDYFGEPVEGWSGAKKTAWENLMFLWVQAAAEAFEVEFEKDPNLANAFAKALEIGGAEWVGVSSMTYPEHPRISFLKFKDNAAQEKYHLPWKEIGPVEQMTLRMEQSELFDEMEHKVRVKAAEMDRQVIDRSKSLAAGRIVAAMLHPKVQAALKDAAMRLSLEKRTDVWDRVPDESFAFYQKDLASLINEFVPGVLNNKLFGQQSESGKAAILSSFITDLKEISRANTIADYYKRGGE